MTDVDLTNLTFVHDTLAMMTAWLVGALSVLVPGECESSLDGGGLWQATHWFEASSPTPRAVALVMHGLNQEPSRMNELIVELNNMGVAVMRLDLIGHGSDPISRQQTFASVDADTWRRQTRCGYLLTRERADVTGVPLVFVAFSLGALVGVDLVNGGGARFEAMVLLAPALCVHWYASGVRLLSAWPGLVLPSSAPEADRANFGTPIAAYEALFALQEGLEPLARDRINVPTLVFIDEDDELVDAAALRAMIADYGLNRWQGISLRKSIDAEQTYHHVIAYQRAVGQQSWSAMLERIKRHLFE
ncbi:MAG: hypothetical protein A2289_05635 [Deltaproteobacteria bacterium RIFOXYA12_FULL_58_15]|nr:MAG: hypothetical protein A2289_05635 [Deltaproteobacteria bacterium RIFOXYA12_FULL_58_15]OGR12451.1 MAG: hypothetical protein A2341_15525 [Deltaproteobacteria bacterium RIFOXYB12_FULL_58_9]